MDTSRQVQQSFPDKRSRSVAPVRQRRSIAEKRRIVEETLLHGASVARVARAHGVNANQVFGWRRLYLAGTTWGAQAGDEVAAGSGEREFAGTVCRSSVASRRLFRKPQPGTIHIELRQAQVRIEGNADAALVRVLLECLRG